MQVGYTAVMARLLDPVEFGLVAMANLFLRFGGYFANMGMSQALIQKADLTDNDVRSAFTSSVLLGLAFFAIMYFTAPLAAAIFKTPDVIPVVKVLSLTFLFSSLSTTSGSLLRRQLKFQQVSILSIIVFVVTAAVAIILAFMGYGVWSLVYSHIVSSILSSILSYALVRHSLKLYFNWQTYKPLFAFGGKISVISLLEFIGLNTDTALIGRYLGASLLGIYSRASMLIQLPLYGLNHSISKVLFPAFSSIQKDITKLRRVYLSSSSVLGFLFFSVCAGASVASEDIVMVVLGEEWKAAIPILSILALMVPFKLLSHYGGVICDSTANLNVKLVWETIYIIVLASIMYGIRNTNLTYYSWSILSMEFVKFVAYLVVMKRILKFDWKNIKIAYTPALITSMIVAGSIFLVKIMIDATNLNYLFKLIIDMATGGIALLIALFLNVNKSILDELNAKVFSQVKFLERIVHNVASQLNK